MLGGTVNEDVPLVLEEVYTHVSVCVCKYICVRLCVSVTMYVYVSLYTYVWVLFSVVCA